MGRGDSLRRKIELKRTLDGICSITANNAFKSCCFLQFWLIDEHYMVTKGTLQHEVRSKLFKAILVRLQQPWYDCKFDRLCVGVINVRHGWCSITCVQRSGIQAIEGGCDSRVFGQEFCQILRHV